ncbi:MAG: DUF4254 domain-containing protein [Pirellulaceae bacterium]|nr:DUF4254 domain-containing protein [Pirellulaceae bacterium]
MNDAAVAKPLIDVGQVLELHARMVRAWQTAPMGNSDTGYLGLVCQQHRYNFELWHWEDQARSPIASDSEIAQVKRNIDRLNQLRNDYIEKLDDWLAERLAAAGIVAGPGARLNTETPGSVVDRLSIMALRIYHYEKQLERLDADEQHRQMVRKRIEICRRQQADLAQSLDELLCDMQQGRKRHQTYRQLKMYNDCTLNPFLYKSS